MHVPEWLQPLAVWLGALFAAGGVLGGAVAYGPRVWDFVKRIATTDLDRRKVVVEEARLDDEIDNSQYQRLMGEIELLRQEREDDRAFNQSQIAAVEAKLKTAIENWDGCRDRLLAMEAARDAEHELRKRADAEVAGAHERNDDLERALTKAHADRAIVERELEITLARASASEKLTAAQDVQIKQMLVEIAALTERINLLQERLGRFTDPAPSAPEKGT